MKTEHAEDAGRLDDTALVIAAQQDRAAFGRLYERYVDPIYRYVYHQVGNHVDAEDVTTRTFQLTRATLLDFEPGSMPFGAWLAAIARDLIAQRQADQEISRDEGAADAAWRAVQPHDEDTLVAALRELPLEEQRAIVLKFARGRTNREIAEALKLSEDEGKQVIHRALIALRAAFESK